MSYLRNPRIPHMWESNGDAPWGKYKAADGTFHDSAKKADEHDRERSQHPWEPASGEKLGGE